jgi:hypothetical protein
MVERVKSAIENEPTPDGPSRRVTRKRVLQSPTIRLLDKTGRGGTKCEMFWLLPPLSWRSPVRPVLLRRQNTNGWHWTMRPGLAIPCRWPRSSSISAVNTTSGETGTAINQIGPDAVTKDAAGNIHVHMTGSRPAGVAQWDFFTSKDECEKYVKDEGISPEQAPAGDIN